VKLRTAGTTPWVALALLLTGCLSMRSMREVRGLHMEAYDCWEDIEVTPIGDHRYRAFGCLMSATYVCEDDRPRCERVPNLP
jgi:hypothetical protein